MYILQALSPGVVGGGEQPLAFIHGINLFQVFGKMHEHRNAWSRCPNLVAFVILFQDRQCLFNVTNRLEPITSSVPGEPDRA